MKKITKKIILFFGIIITVSSNTNSFKADQNIKLESLQIGKKFIESDLKITEEIEIFIEEIENIIENNNLEIKNQKLKVEQSKLNLRSKLAAWYPTLKLQSNGLPKYLDGYSKSNSSNNTLSKQLSASLSAELNWSIINPLRKEEINLAKNQFEKSKVSYLIKLRDIKLKTLKEYFLLQQANEEVKIAEKSVDLSNISLSEAQIRLNAGIGTKLELLEAKTQLSRDKKLLSDKITNRKIKQRSLTNSLNLGSNSLVSIASKPVISGLWEKSLEKSIISAYRFRKELDGIIFDIAISKNSSRLYSAEKKPIINIFNTFSTSFTEGESLVASPNMNKSSSIISNTIGINSTWKIIDGGRIKSLALLNENKAKESQNNYRLKLLEIRKDVEESFYKLNTSQENIITTSQEVETAEESLRLARLKFNAGIITQREIVNHQRDLTDAKVNHIKSITNYNIYLSELSRQTGIDEIKLCNKTNVTFNKIKNLQTFIDFTKVKLIPICN